MVLSNCTHIDLKDQKEIKENYGRIVKHFISNRKDVTGLKLELFQCVECSYKGVHLHCCLHCVYFACPKHLETHMGKKITKILVSPTDENDKDGRREDKYKDGRRRKIVESSQHFMGVQLRFGVIKCFICKSYVYHCGIIENYIQQMLTDFNMEEIFQIIVNRKKRQNQLKLSGATIIGEKSFGIRGISNMNGTCYMNSIIQAITHAPVLRNYFLNDGHHSQCEFLDKAGECLYCEFFDIFEEMYSGKKSPIKLENLLFLLWKYKPNFASTQQQDADEYLIALIDIMNKNTLRMLKQNKDLSPNLGVLAEFLLLTSQSTVICTKCRKESPSVENSYSVMVSPLENGRMTSIVDCLKNLIEEESIDLYSCVNCDTHTTASRKWSIYTLPVILYINIKRSGSESKIGTYIQFPEEIDMGPYTTDYIAINDKPKGDCNIIMEPEGCRKRTIYSLFAVVTHCGDGKEGGHYIAYVRLQDDTWYLCNDHEIEQVSFSKVLESSVNLLFYHRYYMDFK